MHKYLALLFLSSAIAEKCEHAYDNGLYARSVVLTIKGLPTNLAYNPSTKEVLFTLIDIQSLQDDAEQTKMEQYILKEGEPIKIDNVNGQAAVVDEGHNVTYIASDNGIHLLNSSNKAVFLSLKDHDIVQLFKPRHNDDDLYAIEFPENHVYRIDVRKNERKKLDYVPCAFIVAVDFHDNVYYECDSKYMKVLLKDFEEPIEYAGIARGSGRAIAVDRRGRVVLAANDGLYHLSPTNVIPRKMMNLPFVPSGVVFAEKEFFVATSGVIYKFSDYKCK